MSTITVPTSELHWPRAALITVALLVVSLAVAISLALGATGHTITRTVLREVPAADQPVACHWGQPC